MMARNRQEIKAQITGSFMSNPTLAAMYGFELNSSFESQFSLVSFENILFELIAYILMYHEQIVELNAKNSRSHNYNWYRTQGLNFVDGQPLIWKDEQFQYDLSNLNESPISDLKIIKGCAVLPRARGGLTIKTAKKVDEVFQPLSPEELTRFANYMEAIKDAGNKLFFINEQSDDLMLNVTIYVDPLIIDLETGKQLNIDGDVYPVKEAMRNYLNKTEFNGAFVTSKFIDEIQAAVGTQDYEINSIEWKYGANDFAPVGRKQIPYSGHWRIQEANLNIVYEPYSVA